MKIISCLVVFMAIVSAAKNETNATEPASSGQASSNATEPTVVQNVTRDFNKAMGKFGNKAKDKFF